MKDQFDNSSYKTERIDISNAQDFIDYKLRELVEYKAQDPEKFVDITQESCTAHAQQTFINNPAIVAFGLYDNNKIVGYSFIVHPDEEKIDEPPTFGGINILADYRGQHLSRLLHSARIDYLINDTQYEVAQAFILPDNEPSKRASLRAGFQKSATPLNEDGMEPYALDLNAIRSQKNAAASTLEIPAIIS